MGTERRRRLAGRAALILGVLALAASAAAAPAIKVPPPQGYVSDFAGIIDPGTRAELTRLIGELKGRTGAEIAVVTVRSTKPETAFDYAMAIAETWKPGTPGKDNGIVFLVAVDDRQMQILTGYGVEGPLPDGKIGEIRDTIVRPAFRAGDYSRGILAATQVIAAAIAKDAGVTLQGGPPPRPRRAQPSPFTAFLPLIIILLFFLVARALFRPSVYPQRRGGFVPPIFWGGGPGFGGGGFGGGGGGFGGFGGGSFGGGGAGGDW
ncbi:MAG TPA: TPM domain-containing protein [Candidatus Bathyarchaeia archaeon]|nr:TPM domain-containing protein [Candidatus Bathyarchaeia archaeon]